MYGDLHDNVVLWNAEDYAQENPLFTDAEGKYAWDVPTGLWQVKYEKEGYETTYSEWLPVPPPQLEVNIGMTQLRQPAVQQVKACTDGIDELAFGSGKGVDIAVLIQKDCTHAGHGDQNIGGTHFLELFRIGYNGFPCLELHTEDLADFMMIGLDQEGVILQDIEKEILCRVDDKTDSPALERL